MYYLLHRQNVPDKVTNTPDGLTDLMSDITREVLRVRPPSHCVYKFIADYLDALLRVREKTSIAQSVIAELIETSQNVCNFLQQSGVCYDKAKKAATLIEKSFQDFVKAKRCNATEHLHDFKEIELISELITKCRFTEREIARSSPGIRKAFRQFISDYLNLMKATVYGASAVVPIVQFTFKATVRGNLDILNNSATLIQATFRGYKVRAHLRSLSLQFDMFITKIMKHPYVKKKKIKKCAPFDPLRYECMKDEMLYCKLAKAAQIIQRNYRRYHNKVLYNYAYSKRILDRAATIIQKIFRGYLARKRFKVMTSLESYKKYYGQPVDDCQLQYYNKKATIIQKTYKGYRTRKEFKKKKDLALGIRFYSSLDGDEYQMYHDKATVIQANYRGYKTRQNLKLDQLRSSKDDKVKETKGDIEDFEKYYGASINEDDRNRYNKAATKIQAKFRGYIARKHFKLHTAKAAKEITEKPPLNEGTPSKGLEKVEEETAPKENVSPEPVEETPPKEPEQAEAPQEAEEQIPVDEAQVENKE